MPSHYGFARAFVLRLTGLALVALGLLLVLLVALVMLLSLPATVVTGGVAVALGAIVVLGLVATRRVDVVRFDTVGYRIRYIRGAGARQAAWREVEDVAAAVVAGQRCVVLRLRDGRTSTVPVDVLAADRDAFVRDLQQHLTTGHGYRPLREG